MHIEYKNTHSRSIQVVLGRWVVSESNYSNVKQPSFFELSFYFIFYFFTVGQMHKY